MSITEVKFARRVVHRLDAPTLHRSDANILKALVELAHSLGATATATGVTSHGQADRAARLRFDTAQGTYFTDPLRPADVRDFLAATPRP
ncbi:EAL domain-containing protein [Dactylosporangium sp. McL0621]|uniref:EAL domain-containing protein n=1 Tax=Dactylosporangium sp. McL0621 TaxID=3415678 RepID=UPI003CF000B8